MDRLGPILILILVERFVKKFFEELHRKCGKDVNSVEDKRRGKVFHRFALQGCILPSVSDQPKDDQATINSRLEGR